MKRGIDSVYGDSFFYSPLQLKTHLSERTNQADLAKVYGEGVVVTSTHRQPFIMFYYTIAIRKNKKYTISICQRRKFRRCVVCSSYSCFLCSILDYGLKEERAFCFDCIKG
ncbi:hypothetical protein TrispH2_006859 [Trichoplax sp. H2]|nr:hypothetical protein TrispH2_006859 [Trichoplax sp. H2]|eukprot:RDD40013.1 hypothetical protein TrispH2_006859 [Trichoplax sp. H2]